MAGCFGLLQGNKGELWLLEAFRVGAKSTRIIADEWMMSR